MPTGASLAMEREVRSTVDCGSLLPLSEGSPAAANGPREADPQGPPQWRQRRAFEGGLTLLATVALTQMRWCEGTRRPVLLHGSRAALKQRQQAAAVHGGYATWVAFCNKMLREASGMERHAAVVRGHVDPTGCSRLFWIWAIVFLACLTFPGHAAEADTFSKVVSYRFDEVLTGSAAEGGVQSAVVSYLFQEDMGSDTAGGVQSPVVSYLYEDWLGDDQVTFQTSAPVSYTFAALSAPAGIAPGTKALPGPTLTTLTPVCSWGAVSGVDGYGFTVTELTTGTVVYQNLGVGAVTTFTPPTNALYPGYYYLWRVRASRGGEWSADSAALYFALPESVLVAVAPTLVSPGTLLAPGQVVTDLRPTFTWKSVVNAVAHELQAVDVISGATVHSNASLGRATSYVPSTSILQSGHAYGWRVRASNGQTWGPWSQLWHFQTASAVQPPTAPVIVSPGETKPAGRELDAAAVLNFAFKATKATKGATAYALLIADADSGAVLHEHSLPGDATSYALPAYTLLPGKHCWWNLRVQTAQGVSDFSTRLFFQTKPQYPAPVIANLLPAGLPASASTQTMELNGTGFRTGAQVLASYTGKTDVPLAASAVTLNSSTKLTVKLVPGTKSDTWTLKVKNTDGLVSNAMTFVVTPPGGTLLLPTVSQPSAVYVQPVLLTLSSANPAGTEIHYTTDGTSPTRLSPLYATPLWLGAKTLTIKALCTSPTMNSSPVLTQTYVFNLPTVDVPGNSAAVTLGAGQSTYFKLTIRAGLADFSLRSIATQPLLSPGFAFKLAKGWLPVPTGYDRASIPDALLIPGQRIDSVPASPGDYFILAEPEGNSGASAKLSCSVVSQADVLAVPTISPTAGKQYGPLEVSMSHADSGVTIYYTTDGSDPDPFAGLQSSTRSFDHPFIIGEKTTVKARSYKRSKKMSPVMTSVFEIIPGGVQYLTEEPITWPVNGGPPVRTWSINIPAHWSPSETIPFGFRLVIPPDPDPTAAGTLRLVYPVSLAIEPGWQGNISVYLKAGAAPATAKDIDMASLPLIDTSSSRKYVLGPVLTENRRSKGYALTPGVPYAVTVNVSGGNAFDHVDGSDWQASAVKLKFTLHQAELLSLEPQGIQPNTDNTWLSIHGREATADSQYIKDQAVALRAYLDDSKIDGQVLRLNWGTMAATHGADFGGQLSIDESIYTQAVGVRTAEVLRRWQVTGLKLSLCGHSWGAHVAYFIAKNNVEHYEGGVKRLVACDPADWFVNKGDSPDFKKYANHSWAFYAPQSVATIGSPSLSATAQEAFVVYVSPVAGASFGITPITIHKAPFQLFTHFLEANYGANPPLLNQSVAQYFTMDALDGQATSTRFRANQWEPSWVGYPSQKNGGNFEGSIIGKIDNQGLDTTMPLSLHYLANGSISTVPVVIPPPGP